MSFTDKTTEAPSSKLYRAATFALLVVALALLQACAGTTYAPPLQYDFGPLPKDIKQAQYHIAISVADVGAPNTLDGNAMLYRLQYDNLQLLRPYAQHRWSMAPAQLLTQRLKSRIAATGGTVTGAADGIAELPVLRMELDEFSQIFTDTTLSEARITLRASVTKKNKLIAQRYFSFATPSGSADARGGAKAMQATADQSITEILVWLQSVPLNH